MSSELQQIDQLLTHDVFDALCDRGMPMPRVWEFVWPAVEALDHQVKDDSVRLGDMTDWKRRLSCSAGHEDDVT